MLLLIIFKRQLHSQNEVPLGKFILTLKKIHSVKIDHFMFLKNHFKIFAKYFLQTKTTVLNKNTCKKKHFNTGIFVAISQNILYHAPALDAKSQFQ